MAFQLNCGCGCNEKLQGNSLMVLAALFGDHDPDEVKYTCLVCGAVMQMNLRHQLPELVEVGLAFRSWEQIHRACPVCPTFGHA